MSWKFSCFGGARPGCGSFKPGSGGVLRSTPVKNSHASPYAGRDRGDDDVDATLAYQDHHRRQQHYRQTPIAESKSVSSEETQLSIASGYGQKKARARGPDSQEVEMLRPPQKQVRSDGTREANELGSGSVASKNTMGTSDDIDSTLSGLLGSISLDSGPRRRHQLKQAQITDEISWQDSLARRAKEERKSYIQNNLNMDLQRHQACRQKVAQHLEQLKEAENRAHIEEEKQALRHQERIAQIKQSQEKLRKEHELSLGKLSSSLVRRSASSSSLPFDGLPPYSTVQERLALRFGNLSSDAIAKVQEVTTPSIGRGSEIIVSHFKMEILRQHMRLLHGTTWLNDEIVNFCMQLINARDLRDTELRAKYMAANSKEQPHATRRVWCTNSFFMFKLRRDGYKGVKRWAKKAKILDVFTLSRMIVPVNISNSHWTSCHVDFHHKEIIYYDSLGARGDEYLEEVLGYLKQTHLVKKDCPMPDIESWKLRNTGRTVPQQKNMSDCGMFTCAFAMFLSDPFVKGQNGALGLPLDFQQKHMPLLRKRLAWDILRKYLD